FSADQQGSTIYGNAATVAVSGSTNADTGLTYSFDFNNDGDFTDSGEVAESLLTTASYSFPNPGSFKVRVRVKDNLNRFQDYFSVLKVMPTATSAAPTSFSTIAGAYMSYQVATYTDPNLNGVVKDGGVTINWGNGKSSPGMLSLRPDGTYAVFGAHQYATAGNYSVSAQIKNVYGSVTDVPAQTIVVRPALPMTANAIVMTAGDSLSGKVASFTPVTGVNPLGALIAWGDGQSSDGTITANSSGGFDISAQYVYRKSGNYVPSISMVNPGTSVAAGGTASGRFIGDTGFSGGTTAETFDTINMQNVINPAPESVYRKSRVGTDFSYTFNNLAPNGNYAIRLHFADPASRASGQRVFKVSANGNLMLNNFDIYANAGEFSRAVVKAISTTADSSGSITLRFQGLTGNAMVSGVEILPVISSVSTSSTVKDANTVYTPTSLASISRTVNGRLGSFTTTNIYAQASDFMGSIRWGDGLLSDATITGGNGVFNVSGSHRYELGGDYTARVSLGYIAGMGIDSGSSVTTS
ncbi:MAG: malectin domain-containing carbohydrate-binding protein, partial [bacterium]